MDDLRSVLIYGALGWLFAFGMAGVVYSIFPEAPDVHRIAGVQPRLEVADTAPGPAMRLGLPVLALGELDDGELRGCRPSLDSLLTGSNRRAFAERACSTLHTPCPRATPQPAVMMVIRMQEKACSQGHA